MTHPTEPPYPTAPPPPPYPTTATPAPAYPTAPPPYPAAEEPPPYPGAPSTPPPGQPTQVPPPRSESRQAPQEEQPPPRPGDPEDFPRRTGRVHISAHQRGADATVVSQVLLHIPYLICSLAVVSALALGLLGPLGYLVVLGWLASGALVFHRPTEGVLARHLFHLRYPTRDERQRLEPIWREVSARSGIDAHNYELWVENSGELNAYAAAGHIVGVTHYSLNQLPPRQLAAVLAHELGHHRGGHAWASLLGLWYALPARLVWALFRKVAAVAVRVAAFFSGLGALVVVCVLGSVLAAAVLTAWWIVLPMLAAPYLLAAISRRAELRADRHAAELGFAPALVDVLNALHAEEQAAIEQAVAMGRKAQGPGTVARLLSSHPDHYTRLHHLEEFLPATGS